MEPHKPAPAAVWLLPDLSLALALFTLLYALAFYRAPEQLFRDSDTGWHIRTGERILREAAVPRVDTYSFSRPGGEWYAWEWAADAAMGAVHQRGGLKGVVILYLGVIALCSWLWVRLHWACGSNFWAVCLFASPMLTAAQLHWLARPHVFGWVWLLIALLLFESGRMRWFWALALSVVWANTHGSFFLLPLLSLPTRAQRPEVECGREHAEHDENASCLLVSDSAQLLDAVDAEVERQLTTTVHRARVVTALSNQSAYALVDDLDQGLEVVDSWAAEHLEVITVDARDRAARVRNAGAVFVGPWSPVSLGDYLAGSNHVLPTGGSARHTGGLSVQSFLRSIHVVNYTRDALAEVAPLIDALGGAEDLHSHVAAVRTRIPDQS